MRRLIGLFLLGALVLAVAAAPPLGASGGVVYHASAVQACLHREHVSAGVEAGGKQESYNAPGQTATVLVTDFAGAVIDDGMLYFFKTDNLARRGEPQLVDWWVYFRGLKMTPAEKIILQAMGMKEPPKAAVPSLHQRYGNVVAIWNYPRHHVAATNRLLAPCLR